MHSVEDEIGKLRERYSDATRQASFALWGALLTVNGVLLSLVSIASLLAPLDGVLVGALIGLCLISIILIVWCFVLVKLTYQRLGAFSAALARPDWQQLSEAEEQANLRQAGRAHSIMISAERATLGLLFLEIGLVVALLTDPENAWWLTLLPGRNGAVNIPMDWTQAVGLLTASVGISLVLITTAIGELDKVISRSADAIRTKIGENVRPAAEHIRRGRSILNQDGEIAVSKPDEYLNDAQFRCWVDAGEEAYKRRKRLTWVVAGFALMPAVLLVCAFVWGRVFENGVAALLAASILFVSGVIYWAALRWSAGIWMERDL